MSENDSRPTPVQSIRPERFTASMAPVFVHAPNGSHETNTATKIVWWLITTLAAVVMATVTIMINQGNAAISRLTSYQMELSERIARLESRTDEFRRETDGIKGELRSMNDKLDKLLQRRR